MSLPSNGTLLTLEHHPHHEITNKALSIFLFKFGPSNGVIPLPRGMMDPGLLFSLIPMWFIIADHEEEEKILEVSDEMMMFHMVLSTDGKGKVPILGDLLGRNMEITHSRIFLDYAYLNSYYLGPTSSTQHEVSPHSSRYPHAPTGLPTEPVAELRDMAVKLATYQQMATALATGCHR
ncbi:hypothetical protein Scep_023772 [Stephania cephalantha]|uniref:Uncharacterized protein n=1 Tax=Stephania cephalantha TaxID=152367 RepID=A0AAP0EY79_9MAGN